MVVGDWSYGLFDSMQADAGMEEGWSQEPVSRGGEDDPDQPVGEDDLGHPKP